MIASTSQRQHRLASVGVGWAISLHPQCLHVYSQCLPTRLFSRRKKKEEEEEEEGWCGRLTVKVSRARIVLISLDREQKRRLVNYGFKQTMLLVSCLPNEGEGLARTLNDLPTTMFFSIS